jgi:serine/threonine protein kinase
MGLSNLQEQEIKHECLTPKAILTDEEGNVKIVDPLAHALQPNIDLIYNNRNIKHIYLSPEQCESIETQKPIINKNPYRNDVFVLGMILLECGLLERQDQCFLNDCSEVNFDRIEANLKRFGDFYEEELRKMVELMLNRDIRNRPDWIDLIKHVNRNSKNNKDAASARVEIRNSQRHFITRVLASDPEAKRSGSQMQPIRAVPDAQKNSVFYKEPQQILQSGYIVPISTFTPQ